MQVIVVRLYKVEGGSVIINLSLVNDNVLDSVKLPYRLKTDSISVLFLVKVVIKSKGEA